MAELKNDIDLANERVDLAEAARLCGVSGLDMGYSSMKTWCPWGELFHADQGQSKAFRVYADENTAYCFAGCGFFNPVRLVAKQKEISEEEAAEWLLTATGYVPPNIDDQWEAVTRVEEHVDTAYLAEALKMYCRRLTPDWEVLQFEESISEKFRKCLELTARVHTTAEATQWLDVTKQVMTNALGVHTHVRTV